MRIVSGSSNSVIYFVAVSSADFTTRVDGLSSFDVTWSLNGSTGTTVHNMTAAAANTTKMLGVYKINMLDSTVTSIPAGMDSAELCLHIQSSMDTVTRTVEIYRRCVTTGQTLTVNSSGEPTNVMAGLSSIATTCATIASKVSSIDTDIDSVITKVTSIDTRVTAIQAQTTLFTFTQSGIVDANIQYVNDVQVNGVGSTANPWGP